MKFLETLSGTKDVGQQSPSGGKKPTAPQLRCRVFPDLDWKIYNHHLSAATTKKLLGRFRMQPLLPTSSTPLLSYCLETILLTPFFNLLERKYVFAFTRKAAVTKTEYQAASMFCKQLHLHAGKPVMWMEGLGWGAVGWGSPCCNLSLSLVLPLYKLPHQWLKLTPILAGNFSISNAN